MRLFHASKRRVAPSLFFAVTLASPWSALAETEVEREKRQQRAAFVGVVGQWSQVDDGGPAFKVNGEAWSGKTAKAEVEAVGRTLFASIGDPFVANTTGDGAFPLAVWTGTSDFTSGTIRVRFKLVAGASDQTAGIVFNLKPSGEYLFFRYNTKDGNVALWGYENGARRVIAHGETHVKLPMNEWNELVMTIAGNKLTGSVAGKQVTLEHTLDAPISGRVGLWTKRDAITVFKDYRVSR